eukprot:gene5463-9281_t
MTSTTYDVPFDFVIFQFDTNFPLILKDTQVEPETYQQTISKLNKILSTFNKTSKFVSVSFIFFFFVFLLLDILFIAVGILCFFVAGNAGFYLLWIFLAISILGCAFAPCLSICLPLFRYHSSKKLGISMHQVVTEDEEKYKTHGVKLDFTINSQLIPGNRGWRVISFPILQILVDHNTRRIDVRRIQNLIKQVEEENIYQQYPAPGVEELDQPEPMPLKKNVPTMYNIKQPTMVSVDDDVHTPKIVFDDDDNLEQEIQFPEELKFIETNDEKDD